MVVVVVVVVVVREGMDFLPLSGFAEIRASLLDIKILAKVGSQSKIFVFIPTDSVFSCYLTFFQVVFSACNAFPHNFIHLKTIYEF